MQEFLSNISWEMHVFLNPEKNESRNLKNEKIILILLLELIFNSQHRIMGTFLVVQWLRLHASIAGGVGSVPRQETKIPHAVWD